jgi:hypothetical protein
LTREVLRLMLLQKLALASATLLAAGLIAWGAVGRPGLVRRETFQEDDRDFIFACSTQIRNSRSPSRTEIA